MVAHDLSVDFAALREFHSSLAPRLDQARAALDALTAAPGDDRPALGGFHDGQQRADRHQLLHDEYVLRLSRLVDALRIAEQATAEVLRIYLDADAAVDTTKVDRELDGVSEVGDGSTKGG
ncbi:hypothetical protein [Asanoa siamensis]|uniref:PE family protein n=1 Tax=Asanoa siamensis TaxID=926357 RepID=A0ABQ4CR70_9ACTN|nr:hypothetical protein [Asanoa siamensis]GIF73788.1 hypothetical protein Asi02nite_33060 [Asanoa siamensis]